MKDERLVLKSADAAPIRPASSFGTASTSRFAMSQRALHGLSRLLGLIHISAWLLIEYPDRKRSEEDANGVSETMC